jgi:hypothetical protein
MKPGTKVRMSEAFKQELIANNSGEHVDEFGNCIGVVEDLVDYNNVDKAHPDYDIAKVGPEVNVRWYPSKLRYGYHPDNLVALLPKGE